MRLVFDSEGDGLLKYVTKIHCIAALDIDTGEMHSWRFDQIDDALAFMYEADELIGHNCLGYDFPAFRKLYNWNPRPGCKRTDTLVVARLIHSDIRKEDSKRVGWPGKLFGSHSLRAWGKRLGVEKGDYGYDEKGDPIPGAWDAWTPEMQEYMENDVVVNAKLLNYLKPWDYPQVPLELEHRIAQVCLDMSEAGWPFDVAKAQALYVDLCSKRDEIERRLVDRFGSWQEVDKIFVPKRDNKRLGYKQGVEVTKYKTVTFNPGSRKHIQKKLAEFGWKPTKFTESGQPSVDADELEQLEIPEAKDLVEYLLIQKRLGYIADGKNGWLKLVDERGLIHPEYNSNGTPYGRASHYDPNIAQVPSCDKPYGHECRELFHVPTGWKQIGADMSGLQLRCLSHFIAFFDGGEYAKIVLDGDIHTYHWKICEPYVKTRRDSKTTIYAYLYGAGPGKLGLINSAGAKVGREIINRLATRVPGLGKLRRVLDAAAKKGWIKGLDGRQVPIRSEHSALNYLVANAEAVLTKTWVVNAYDTLRAAGLKHGWDGDFVFLGWIHDELQVAARGEHVEFVRDTLVRCAQEAGEPYGFKVRLDSEAKIGMNWAETH